MTLAFNSEIQTYQMLTHNNEVCIPSLSSILLAVHNRTRQRQWQSDGNALMKYSSIASLKCMVAVLMYVWYLYCVALVGDTNTLCGVARRGEARCTTAVASGGKV